MSALRVYEERELGKDGYPHAWHDLGGAGAVALEELLLDSEWALIADMRERIGIKDVVRAAAGHRCERCGHPFVVGQTGELTDSGTRLDIDSESFTAMNFEMVVRQQWPEIVGDRAKTIRTHWSPCDEQCSHKGPVRWNDNLPGAPAGIKQGWVTGDVTVPVGELVQRDEGQLEYQAAWRILTVHHLNGRKFDCRWWNLAALCQRCHLYIQRKVQMERVYPYEHTDWFKLHAAGWYSYAYLGQELTRQQAVERVDELLALERMA